MDFPQIKEYERILYYNHIFTSEDILATIRSINSLCDLFNGV